MCAFSHTRSQAKGVTPCLARPWNGVPSPQAKQSIFLPNRIFIVTVFSWELGSHLFSSYQETLNTFSFQKHHSRERRRKKRTLWNIVSQGLTHWLCQGKSYWLLLLPILSGNWKSIRSLGMNLGFVIVFHSLGYDPVASPDISSAWLTLAPGLSGLSFHTEILNTQPGLRCWGLCLLASPISIGVSLRGFFNPVFMIHWLSNLFSGRWQHLMEVTRFLALRGAVACQAGPTGEWPGPLLKPVQLCIEHKTLF